MESQSNVSEVSSINKNCHIGLRFNARTDLFIRIARVALLVFLSALVTAVVAAFCCTPLGLAAAGIAALALIIAVIAARTVGTRLACVSFASMSPNEREMDCAYNKSCRAWLWMPLIEKDSPRMNNLCMVTFNGKPLNSPNMQSFFEDSLKPHHGYELTVLSSLMTQTAAQRLFELIQKDLPPGAFLTPATLLEGQVPLQKLDIESREGGSLTAFTQWRLAYRTSDDGHEKPVQFILSATFDFKNDNVTVDYKKT